MNIIYLAALFSIGLLLSVFCAILLFMLLREFEEILKVVVIITPIVSIALLPPLILTLAAPSTLIIGYSR